jgi:hypothetical protein
MSYIKLIEPNGYEVAQWDSSIEPPIFLGIMNRNAQCVLYLEVDGIMHDIKPTLELNLEIRTILRALGVAT